MTLFPPVEGGRLGFPLTTAARVDERSTRAAVVTQRDSIRW